jgi:hypothetical protein
MNRQRNLDAPAVRCANAHRTNQRPHCQLTATVRYGTVALCPDCDNRRSTLGKATTAHQLPTSSPVNVLDWLTHAERQLHQARTELAAAATRARNQGHSWTAIGAALNITKQAAQQRFRQDHPRQG